MVIRYRPYGQAYGVALATAVEAVGQATSICTVPFATAGDGIASAAAYQRLEHVLSRHIRLLVGPRETVPRNRLGTAAMELAAVMESNARQNRAAVGMASHPAGRAWESAAQHLATAHDILASHLDIDRNPLTPEGELILHSPDRWPVVARLADVTLTLEKQRRGLARQLSNVSTLHFSSTVSLRDVRLDHPNATQAAARTLDLSKREPTSSSLLDRIDPAPPVTIRQLPADPLDRAVVLVDSLRRYAYDLMREGAGVGADAMSSYAALAVDIAGNALAIVNAAHSRAETLLGEPLGALAQPVLAQGTTAMQLVGRRWRSVYRHWGQAMTLYATPSLVRHRVLLVREALAGVSRDGYAEKAAADLLPDSGRFDKVIGTVVRLISHLGPLAQHQCATASHMQAAGGIITQGISDPSARRTRARLWLATVPARSSSPCSMPSARCREASRRPSGDQLASTWGCDLRYFRGSRRGKQ